MFVKFGDINFAQFYFFFSGKSEKLGDQRKKRYVARKKWGKVECLQDLTFDFSHCSMMTVGCNDSFVVIKLGKEKSRTSVKLKSGPNVEWNEECEL